MANERIFGRRMRAVVSTPVSTPGDYTHVTTDQIEINAGDDPEHPGLRMAFKSTKTDGKEPNTAELTITNLSPVTRSRMQVKGVKVVVEAGYKTTGLSRIFSGDARSVDHIREKADWQTKIKVGDGERSYRHARLSESFAAGASGGDVLRRLAEGTGLELGNVPEQARSSYLTSLRFDHGYAVSGRVSDSLDRFIRSIGWRWWVQDGALFVLAPGETYNPEIPLISPETGLIGSPEMGTPEKKGKPALLKFRCLLRPLTVGGRVRLKSLRYDGEVVLRKVDVTADTHGGDWYCDCHGVIHAK